MKIITIANQKGGCGKSTTAAALAACLQRSGKRVLAVDADPQGSLTYLMGADPNGKTLYDALRHRPAFLMQRTEQGEIFAGDKRLAAEQVKAIDLRRTLRGFVHDYIIIDTGPGLTSLLLSALYAADMVIIPTKANSGSLRGITDTLDTLEAVKGDKKTPCGVILTQIHTRNTNAEKAFIDAIRQTCEERDIRLYDTVIRYAEAAVTSAEACRQSVVAYDIKSNPAQDYFRIMDEMGL